MNLSCLIFGLQLNYILLLAFRLNNTINLNNNPDLSFIFILSPKEFSFIFFLALKYAMINSNAKKLETLVITQNRHKTNGIFKKKNKYFPRYKIPNIKGQII